MQRKTINYGAIILIAAGLVAAAYTYWLHQKIYPSTDDATIEAHVVNIAAQVNGKVQTVYVKNQAHVVKNQLLFTLDPKPFEIAIQKAQAAVENTKQAIQADENGVKIAAATLAERQAELVNAQKEYDRIYPLAQQGYYPKTGADKVNRDLIVAKEAVVAAQDQLAQAQDQLGKAGDQNAQLQAATAALAQAKLNLQYANVLAPASGQLAQLSLQPGQTITAYESLFSLVEDHTWWAMANMKETNLNRVRVGQKAMVHVDMYPAHPFRGTVIGIAAGSGSSFSLLPSENASGNWVKVTQRFPVRIQINNPDKKFPLRIGASCTVTIDTHA
jgi:membrane fusion protein (multidrug efflux system)